MVTRSGLRLAMVGVYYPRIYRGEVVDIWNGYHARMLRCYPTLLHYLWLSLLITLISIKML
jgi:hypothetical protein